jgi:DNA protecting protein DprA
MGDDSARAIVEGLKASAALAEDELALAEKLGVHILAITEPDYPPLLRSIPTAPPILFVRGRLDPHQADRYSVAIVGSRSCTQYAMEQAERFAMGMGQAGLTIVSGGARGVDTAAHRAALRVKARTIAVLGCGLAECYPPDNRELFDRIVGEDLGAIVSELPLRTPPNAENFPARNRIISGLSLGVLVVEAGKRSGALITARQAVEEHNREVFALPARVDSSAAEGSLALLKSGGAQLVTHPDDILQSLESPARHLYAGTHEARFALSTVEATGSEDDKTTDAESGGVPESPAASAAPLFAASAGTKPANPRPSPTHSRVAVEQGTTTQSVVAPNIRNSGLSARQESILAALDRPRSADDLARTLALEPGALRADMTMLEIRRRVRRAGTLFERVSAQ